ncbi:MAG: translational machinery protein [Sandaracinaceae bacterium]|nr:translational machinery protein [Sandaracinaceae bacterium]
MTRHSTVWIDHKDAKVFYLGDANFEEKELHAPKSYVTSDGAKHAKHTDPATATFFANVAKVLTSADSVLLVGPGPAKLEFVHYLTAHNPQLAARVVGVESADHPTDRQIVAHARAYFATHDRMDGVHVR